MTISKSFLLVRDIGSQGIYSKCRYMHSHSGKFITLLRAPTHKPLASKTAKSSADLIKTNFLVQHSLQNDRNVCCKGSGCQRVACPLRQDPQHQGDQATPALLGTIWGGLSQLLEQHAPYHLLHICVFWEMKVILLAKHQGESLFYKEIHTFLCWRAVWWEQFPNQSFIKKHWISS